MTENQIFYDLFNLYADETTNDHYSDPFSSEVIGKNILALGIETLIFISLNFIIEMFTDDNPPTSKSNADGNILKLFAVTKYYRSFREKIKAVDNLR